MPLSIVPSGRAAQVRIQTRSELEPTEFGFRIPTAPAGIVRAMVQADPAWQRQAADDVCAVGRV